MKLNYNILWFEDDIDSFEGKKELVKSIIVDELGFNFPEPRREIDGSNISTINYDNYDLLIVDLKLANTKGTELIEKIRNSEGVYTEVIFYSAAGEEAVRQDLRNLNIDGAYCADRGEDFEDKVRKVIRTTIKKVQDLNNMRGLILAETSDIEKIMFKIILTVIEKNKSVGSKLSTEIYNNISAKIKEKNKKFEKCTETDIDKVINDNLIFDAYEKINAIQFIFDSIDNEITSPYKSSVFKTKYTEINKTRNLLGHEPQLEEDGKIIIGSGNSKIEFNDEFCINIRKDIKKYGDDLDKLLLLINS